MQYDDDYDKRGRASPEYALIWRPKFLAALSLTWSPVIAARAAGVHRSCANDHYHADEEFAEHYREAQADAVELLHARALQRSLEGDCEPVPQDHQPRSLDDQPAAKEGGLTQ